MAGAAGLAGAAGAAAMVPAAVAGHAGPAPAVPHGAIGEGMFGVVMGLLGRDELDEILVEPRVPCTHESIHVIYTTADAAPHPFVIQLMELKGCPLDQGGCEPLVGAGAARALPPHRAAFPWNRICHPTTGNIWNPTAAQLQVVRAELARVAHNQYMVVVANAALPAGAARYPDVTDTRRVRASLPTLPPPAPPGVPHGAGALVPAGAAGGGAGLGAVAGAHAPALEGGAGGGTGSVANELDLLKEVLEKMQIGQAKLSEKVSKKSKKDKKAKHSSSSSKEKKKKKKAEGFQGQEEGEEVRHRIGQQQQQQLEQQRLLILERRQQVPRLASECGRPQAEDHAVAGIEVHDSALQEARRSPDLCEQVPRQFGDAFPHPGSCQVRDSSRHHGGRVGIHRLAEVCGDHRSQRGARQEGDPLVGPAHLLAGQSEDGRGLGHHGHEAPRAAAGEEGGAVLGEGFRDQPFARKFGAGNADPRPGPRPLDRLLGAGAALRAALRQGEIRPSDIWSKVRVMLKVVPDSLGKFCRYAGGPLGS